MPGKRDGKAQHRQPLTPTSQACAVPGRPERRHEEQAGRDVGMLHPSCVRPTGHLKVAE